MQIFHATLSLRCRFLKRKYRLHSFIAWFAFVAFPTTGLFSLPAQNAGQGLTWADRRVNMEASYAQALIGTASGKNDIYVIASTAGGVPSFAWSSNGLAWQQGEVSPDPDGKSEFVSALTFLEGSTPGTRLWAAVGPSGLLLLSHDNARTWERRPPVLDGLANFIGIAGGNGVLLASGRGWKPDGHGGGTVGGTAFISRDQGETWTQSDVDTENGLTAPVVLDGAWIIAGENGVIARSTDEGETWQVQQGRATGSYSSIAAGNGIVVLIGAQGGGTVIERSLDQGATWEEVFPASEGWVSGVAFGDKRFVLSGGSQTQSGAMSFDGKNWISSRGTGAWGTLGHGPKGFLAVGGTYGRMSTIANPPSITPESSPEFIYGMMGRPLRHKFKSTPGGASFLAVGLPPGLKLATGGGFSGKPTRAGNYQVFLYALRGGFAGDVRTTILSITDPDGPGGVRLAWQRFESGLSGLGYGAESTAFGGESYVSVGANSNGEVMAVRSTNGRDWEVCALPISPEQYDWGRLRAVAGIGPVWLAAGAKATLLRSTNYGQSWTELSPPGDTPTFSGLATNGTHFLLVGQQRRVSGGDGAAAFLSNDGGLSWEEIPLPDLPPLRLAGYENGTWWIGGQEGWVLRAENPLALWEDVSPPSGQDVRALSSYGSVVVTAVQGGNVFRSLDNGTSWQEGAAGSGFWPLNLVNYQGLFVLSGGDRAAGSSSRDGLAWELPSSGGAYGPIAKAATGNQVKLVSLNGEEVWEVSGPWVPGVLQPVEPPVYWIGQPIDFSLLASGDPTSWTVTGLPAGLFFDPRTQSLIGSTRKLGRVWISFSATNAAGTSNVTRIPFTFETPFPIAVGSYQSVLPPHPLNEEMGGRLTLQINRLGIVSGRAELGMRTYPFRGELAWDGTGTILLDPAAGLPLNLTLAVGMDETEAGTLSGNITQGAENLPLTGFRNPWHPRSNPASAWSAKYHSGWFADDTNPDAPAGTGFARLTVSTNGRAASAGRLANHQSMTSSGFLSPDGEWQFFARQGRLGCVSGTLPIDPTLDGKPFLGTVRWTVVTSSRTDGFQTDLLVRGSQYVRPARNTMLWDLPDSPENTTFYRSTTPPASLSLDSKNRFVPPLPPPLHSLVLQIPAGTWRGAFLDDTGRKTSFQGQILTLPWNMAVGYALPGGISEAVQLRPSATTSD